MWQWIRGHLTGQPAVSPDTAEPGSDNKGGNAVVQLLSEVSESRDRAAVLTETVSSIVVVVTICAATLLVLLFAGACVIIMVAGKELGGVSVHYVIPLGFVGGGAAVTMATIFVKRGVKGSVGALVKVLKSSQEPGADGE